MREEYDACMRVDYVHCGVHGPIGRDDELLLVVQRSHTAAWPSQKIT